MADVDVKCTGAADGWLCQVTVAERGSESRHTVTLRRGDYQRLAFDAEAPESPEKPDLPANRETPESLVRRSFEFLLARESKESILRSFDLMVIGRYFPEYEHEIKREGS